MRLSILIGAFLLPFLSWGQKKQPILPKNECKIYYHTTFSKMNYDLSEVSGLGFVKFWVDSQPPSVFYRGKTLGIEYGRNISSNNRIFFAARHTVKGQQSPHYFNSIGDTNEENYTPGYGGKSYEAKLKTNEFLLALERQFFNTFTQC